MPTDTIEGTPLGSLWKHGYEGRQISGNPGETGDEQREVHSMRDGCSHCGASIHSISEDEDGDLVCLVCGRREYVRDDSLDDWIDPTLKDRRYEIGLDK